MGNKIDYKTKLENNRKWKRNNKEKVSEYRKKWNNENKEKVRASFRKFREIHKDDDIGKNRALFGKKWAKENRERIKISRSKLKSDARNKSKNIIIPKEQICQDCNEKLAEEKHHPDYSKPLEVKFLCKKCHNKTKWKN